MPEIWHISKICQLRISAGNSRFHSKFRIFGKNNENFRGNLGKIKKKSMGKNPNQV